MNSPAEVAKNYVGIGAGKTKLPFGKMLLLAILAGMFIAFAGVGSQVVAVSVEAASLGKFLGACVFPAGLAMVLVAGSELFTGNNLIVISVMEKQATWAGLLRNWVVVYIGNFIGGVLVAALVTYGHTPSLFDGALASSMVSAASGKVALSFGDALHPGYFVQHPGVHCRVDVLCRKGRGREDRRAFLPPSWCLSCAAMSTAWPTCTLSP